MRTQDAMRHLAALTAEARKALNSKEMQQVHRAAQAALSSPEFKEAQRRAPEMRAAQAQIAAALAPILPRPRTEPASEPVPPPDREHAKRSRMRMWQQIRGDDRND